VRNGTSWSQQQKLIASDATANDFFGYSVAISGETIVVGAPIDTVGANVQQGSAYVFVRSGASWSQQQKLTAVDGAASDWFGFAVSISGDTVAVGAFRNTVGSHAEQGSLYVFVRSGTSWSQQQKLTASDGAANDHFGGSAAISGNTVVVGSPNDPNGSIQSAGSA
jgi:FG-GAP repeat protein